jgi:hypothetical protein
LCWEYIPNHDVPTDADRETPMKHFHHWRWRFRASARSTSQRTTAFDHEGAGSADTERFEDDRMPTQHPEDFVDTLPRVFRAEAADLNG